MKDGNISGNSLNVATFGLVQVRHSLRKLVVIKLRYGSVWLLYDIGEIWSKRIGRKP